MPISLDAINRLRDSDHFALSNTQPDGVKTTGFWHNIKCRFGFFGARKENRETIQ